MMLPTATREGPVRWNTLLHDLLHDVGLAPTPAVVTSLNALTSYAASPLTLYSDPVTGSRAVKLHGSLLLALHMTTSSWPTELVEKLALPSVHIEDRNVSVSGPAMEMFVLFYNAAVTNCNAGIAFMERVHAHYARSLTPSSCPSVSLNGDTRSAFKSFQLGAEIATYGEQALAEESENLLSATDCYLVQTHFDFRTLREMAELCMAVAKYVHAATSGNFSEKHDSLAKLAHKAYTVRLPSAYTSESLRFLPALLLAAYHRHRAEHYNKAARVPDMSLVLGHIAYARKLVNNVEREFVNSIAASSSSNKNTRQSGGWQLLGRLSATILGVRASNNDAEMDDDSSSVQSFRKLAEMLEGSDLLRVFPLAHILLRDIAALYEKYQHENSVVYYMRPAKEEDVIADAPEIEPLGRTATPPKFAPLAIQLSADVTKFDELPAVEKLREMLQQREAARVMREGVQKQIEEVQELVQKMELALVLPPNVESDLARLEGLLYKKKGVILTLEERFEEAYESVSRALRRHENANEDLSRAKGEYSGKNISGVGDSNLLNQRERAWRRKADAVRAAFVKELPYFGDVTLRESLSLPGGTGLRLCITQAKLAVARAKETLVLDATPSDACAVHLAELKEVRKESIDALDQMAPLCTESRWERVSRALSDAVEVITAAEELVETMENELRMAETLKNCAVPAAQRLPQGACVFSQGLRQQQQQQQMQSTSPSRRAGRRVKRGLSPELQSDEEEGKEEEKESGRKSVELPLPPRKRRTEQRRKVSRKTERQTKNEGEEEEDRSPPVLPMTGKGTARNANAAELAGGKEMRVPEAIASASLLQRLRRRQQELEGEE
ncbi:hypothetical protein MOQ_007277 [Trypanosoma cruzi marinkellei]|uniref:Uncharacterized protein n=1 Tax=Trypanosoma cruzi marinkellei TaxID=85056 RepID=K2M1Y8_TRYCR|nr:hypothetical protein MOQ_007277 [Trypanosoma cruzi marinkellei]